MEYPFPSKDKGINYWASSANSKSDKPPIVDAEARNTSEVSFVNMSEMMSLDNYAGWCDSPSTTEQLLASYGFPSVSPNYASFDQLSFSEQNTNDVYPSSDIGFVDKMTFSSSDMQFDHVTDENYPDSKHDSVSVLLQGKIPRPLGLTLSERMLRALSLFKESSGGGILAQMWVPIRDGDNYILSTCEQPYLLDQMLLGYREVSRSFTFSMEEKPGSFPGLPGRVFISKMPEWTSNVSYYNSGEYLRVKHAQDHEVRGSVAIPIFSPSEMSCCAVLELVTVREKPNFDSEMESVCRALEAVDLRTSTPSRLRPQRLLPNQKTALSEIADVLRAVCHAHRLPLALTWIPCSLELEEDDDSKLNKTTVLCVEETACYVSDKKMQGFVHACVEHPLGEGKGVAGKALQSNVPFFSADVKNYHINEYPLVQHARKFQLNAAVSIRLRSTYTGSDDYILEFFLPISMKGTKEQQLLLDSLSGTMQRMCRSLRTVSDAELDGFVGLKNEQCGLTQSSFPRDVLVMNSRNLATGSEFGGIDHMCLDKSVAKKDGLERDGFTEQVSGLRRHTEKKRSPAEKTVSLSVLQRYFSGSLKDAAKSIGVCPTTLKRICRQHGISRWPSRKINKVNRSLKKIQTVLDSVEGVEGGLKFDPTTCELVSAGSVIQEYDPHKSVFLPTKNTPANQIQAYVNTECAAVKLEKDFYENGKEEPKKSDISTENYVGDFRKAANLGHCSSSENHLSSSSMTDSSNASGSLSSPDNRKGKTTNAEELGSRITVKATYGEDMIRFKVETSVGCLHIYEEVAKRFRLVLGTFQLKYLDDEEEWVMMVSDSDLQECLETMVFVGKQSVKFLVRDMPSGGIGSSGNSSCFLTPGS